MRQFFIVVKTVAMFAGFKSMIGAYATAVRCSDLVLKCALYLFQSGIVCCFEKGDDFGSAAISRHKDRNMSKVDREPRHLHTNLSVTLFYPQDCDMEVSQLFKEAF